MTVIGSKSTAPAQKTPEQLEHCQPSRADHQTAAAALATPNPNDGAACIHMPPPSERRRKRKATYHEYIAERIRPHCFHVPIMATKELSADFRRLRVPVALNAIVLLVDVGKLAYDCIRWDEVLATMVTMVIGSGMLWVLYMYCLGLYAPNAMLQPTGRGLMRGTLDEMAQLRRLLRAYMASIYLVMLQVMATWLLMGYLNWWPLRFGLDRPLMSFSIIVAVANSAFLASIGPMYLRVAWHVEVVHQMGSSANAMRYQHTEKHHPEKLVFMSDDDDEQRKLRFFRICIA